MKFLLQPLLLSLFVSSSSALASKDKTGSTIRCESAKEFITTYEYLRDNSNIAGSGDNAVKVASQVAEGCTGGAQRFIQTLQFMKKIELPIQEILTTSIEFAKREDVHVAAFKEVFKRSYAEDGFDLNIDEALRNAKAISVEFNGNIENALKDFQKISDFCTQADKVFLPRANCARLATKVALSGKDSGPMASDAFIQAYQFLKTRVELTTAESLRIAENLVTKDPQAFENFRLSYEYALSEKGLKVDKRQAILFGQKIAALTVKEVKNPSAK